MLYPTADAFLLLAAHKKSLPSWQELSRDCISPCCNRPPVPVALFVIDLAYLPLSWFTLSLGLP